jgi:hypothetical protein
VINIDTFHYKFGQGGCLRLVSQDQSGTRLSSSRAGDRGKPQNLAVDSLILPLPSMPPLKRTAGNSHGRRGRRRRGHPLFSGGSRRVWSPFPSGGLLVGVGELAAAEQGATRSSVTPDRFGGCVVGACDFVVAHSRPTPQHVRQWQTPGVSELERRATTSGLEAPTSSGGRRSAWPPAATMDGGDGRKQIIKMLRAACAREPREVEHLGEGSGFFLQKI